MASRVLKPRPSCRIQRCKRRPSLDGLCKTHATEEADRLFSLAVREVGYCEVNDGKPHNGNLQCCHLFSRSYKAIRWDRRNALSGCQAHHTYYTHRPVEWDELMRERLGYDLYAELRDLALTHVAPPLDEVLAELRAAA
jgi:hypothetical protein